MKADWIIIKVVSWKSRHDLLIIKVVIGERICLWLPKCSFHHALILPGSFWFFWLWFHTVYDSSLVKSSFMTRINACGFPETDKTIVVILTMFPLKKQVQYYCATYIVHDCVENYRKPTLRFILKWHV